MRRRDFLKASAVTAGASLIDGCKEPEPEYIVQMVRPTGQLPGEPVWRPGVCRQCPAGCGIQVRVIDGNAKKIEGNEAHPVNLGGVCALGHSVLQELYNPDRLLQAQRSTGSRGDGSFESMAWDDAVARAVESVGGASPDRIAIIATDRSGFTGALWSRFADALGAPPPAFLEAPELAVERLAARIALGVDDYPHFDLARAETVLSIGAPLLDRWRSPVHYTRAFADMRRARATRRGRLIQAEARMSLTAANADDWLPVVPGSEGVFARAVAGLVMSSGAADAQAVRRYRLLFPADPPTPAEAAEACGVAEERIRQVADELAATEDALVVGGGSAASYSNGLFNVVAALGLNVLLGNLGRPGGVFAPASFGLTRGLAPAGVGETPIADVAARLRGDGTPVDLLIVAEADPLHQLPAGWGRADLLSRAGTIIALSSFRNDTALQADLILPVATELERFEAAEPTTSVGIPVLGVAGPVVDPVGDGVHPADVVLALADGLGGDIASRFAWRNFQALVTAQVEEQLEELPGGAGASASSYLRDAADSGGIFGEGDPSGTPPGPSGPAPQASDALMEGSADEYAFVLLPFESIKAAEGSGSNRPWLQEHPDPLSTVMWNSWVEISPTDAERLGIHDNDLLRVSSPSGSVEGHAVLDPGVRPGVLSMPLGFGYQDYGRYAEGRGANVLDLIGSTQVAGTSAFARGSTRVRVERLGPGELVRFGRSYEDRGENEEIPVGWAPHEPVRTREARV